MRDHHRPGHVALPEQRSAGAHCSLHLKHCETGFRSDRADERPYVRVGLSTPAMTQAVGDLLIALTIDELCSLGFVLCSWPLTVIDKSTKNKASSTRSNFFASVR